MTNLRNQLRAALYLASRDAYVKGAFVLPALWVLATLLTILLTPQNADMHLVISFEQSLFTIMNAGAVFGTCFAVVGITVHDLSSGGLRASIATGRGRADYVATRMILALLLSVVLTAWAVLLGLILLLAPGAQLGGMPLGELVLRALASVLVGWTYAAFGLLLLWLSRRSRGFGTTLLISIMLAGGLLNLALLIPMAAAVPFSQELAYDLAQLLMPLQPAALLDASAVLDPGPVVMCAAFIVAFWAISHKLMARVSL